MSSRARSGIGFQIAGITFANLVFVLSQFVVLWALARFTDLETVGRFGLAMAVVQPVFMLGRMGFRDGLATDIGERYTLQTYLGVSLMLSVLAGLSTLAIVSLISDNVLSLALPLALAKAVEAISFLLYGGFQRDGETRHVARSILRRGILGSALFAILLSNGVAVEHALWAQTTIWSIVLIFHDIPLYRRTRPFGVSFSPRVALHLVRENGTLGLGQFMSTLQMSVPRVLIELLLGTAALGLFTVVGYLQQAAIVFLNAMGHVIAPRLAHHWHGGRVKAFRRLLVSMLGVAAVGAVCCVVVGLLVGPELLIALFGSDFAGAAGLLSWIVVAIGLRLISSILQSGLTAQRRFDAIGGLQGLLLIVAIPAAWIGIATAGLEGAGMALAALAALRLILTALLLRKGSRPDA